MKVKVKMKEWNIGKNGFESSQSQRIDENGESPTSCQKWK